MEETLGIGFQKYLNIHFSKHNKNVLKKFDLQNSFTNIEILEQTIYNNIPLTYLTYNNNIDNLQP